MTLQKITLNFMNLFKNIYFLISVITFSVFAASCDDTTDTLGMSLTDKADIISVMAEEYNIASHSVAASKVVSRSRIGYLGKIKDTETDNYITCNYMTQFHVMKDSVIFPSIDKVYIEPEKYDASIEKYKQIEADSCCFILTISNSFGDSLALMKVSVNELSIPYEENTTYTTEFDPEAEGMIRTDNGSVHSQMAYTTANYVYTEKQRQASSTKKINISLNSPYTDKEGNVYNNYGTYLLRNYFDPAHKDYYSNSYKFAHNICPGFYVKHEGGIGNVASIISSQVLVYYRFPIKEDSVIVSTTSFAGTEEIIQKTTILQDKEKFNVLINDNSCTYIKSPASVFTELILPIENITTNHEQDTINTARLFIPRINDTEDNDLSLSIPNTLLILPTDSVDSFFDNRKVADYRTSYIATYSSTTNGYTFSNISLLISMMNNIRKEAIAKGKTLSENWNKVTLIPVETAYSTESTSTLTKVTHDMSFASTKLKKGEEDSENIKISVIYSKFHE